MTTEKGKGKTVIRKRGNLLSNITKEERERGKALNKIRKANPFFQNMKGETYETILEKCLAGNVPFSKGLDSINAISKNEKERQTLCFKLYNDVPKYKNQSRSFESRYKDHFFKNVNEERRALRRIL